jgi:hypothetical protein
LLVQIIGVMTESAGKLRPRHRHCDRSLCGQGFAFATVAMASSGRQLSAARL